MLEIKDVVAGYGPMTVLNGISLSVRRGEIVGLMGRNGAGKTTFLRTIMGLVKLQSGSIKLGDREVAGVAPHKIPGCGIGYVPQGRRLFPQLTVAENIRMGLLVKNSPQSDAEPILNLFPKLRDRLEQIAGTLSGGEQQMLAVARALAVKPTVLMLDEPSEGLTPSVTYQILDAVAALKASGTGVLIVEQQVKSALRVCDRIALIEMGKIRHEGSAAELAADATPLERYIGVRR